MSYKFTTGSVRRGDIYFEDDDTGAATYIDFGEDTITLRPSGGAQLYVEDEKVGIGTTSPDHTLHVKSPGTCHVKIESEAGYEAALKIKSGGQSSAYVWQPGSTSDLRFYLDGADVMHLDSDGKVGIGTTDPEAYLDIKNTTDDGATNRTMIQMYNYRADDANENDWAPTSIDFKIENVAGGVKGATARIATVIAPVGTDHSSTEGEKSSALIFSTMDDATLAEAMRINNLGYVGIGTDDPGETLTVDGDISATGDISSDGDILLNNTQGIKIKATGGYQGMVMDLDDANHLNIGTWTGSDIRLSVNASDPKEDADVSVLIDGASPRQGNVGIGTGTEAYSKLSISGSVQFNVTVFTADDTLDGTHHVAVADCNAADVTLTLAEATNAITGRQYIIKRADSSNSNAQACAIAPAGGDAIDGGGSITNIDDGTSHTLICIGNSGWIIVDKYVGI